MTYIRILNLKLPNGNDFVYKMSTDTRRIIHVTSDFCYCPKAHLYATRVEYLSSFREDTALYDLSIQLVRDFTMMKCFFFPDDQCRSIKFLFCFLR